MRVIGIESSCDETAVAVYDPRRAAVAPPAQPGRDAPGLWGRGAGTGLPGPRPAAAAAGSRGSGRRQIRPRVHRWGRLYGGPGPHRRAVGGGRASPRSLAYAWGKPAIGIHHLEGHLLAPLLEPNPPAFPVSRPAGLGRAYPAGRCRGLGRYRILGETWTMRRARPSTRPPSCSGCPIREARRSRAWPSPAARRFVFPAADARPAGPRFQFQWLEDRRPSSLAGPRFGRREVARTSHAVSRKRWSRRSPRNAGGAGKATGSSAPGGRRRRGRESDLCASGWPPSRATTRRGVVFSADRILHGQRRHDRAGRMPALQAAGLRGAAADCGPPRAQARSGELGTRGHWRTTGK
jgi:hypothetical protein